MSIESPAATTVPAECPADTVVPAQGGADWRERLTALLADYQQAWQQFLSSQQQYEDLAREATRLKTEYDFIRFQLDELQKAGLRENELEELESNLAISEHGEDIKMRLNQALAMLSQAETSAQSVLAAALAQLNPLRSYASSYDHLAQRLDSVRIELNDLIRELEHEEEKIEFDPKRTIELKERLDLINGLLTKHRLHTISEVLAVQETLEQQARKTINLDTDLVAAKVRFDESQRQLQNVADKLSASRSKTYQPLTRQSLKHALDGWRTNAGGQPWGVRQMSGCRLPRPGARSPPGTRRSPARQHRAEPQTG